eukprot:scaffold194191_cov46-Prasinocladus_malaysianus.AAC.3
MVAYFAAYYESFKVEITRRQASLTSLTLMIQYRTSISRTSKTSSFRLVQQMFAFFAISYILELVKDFGRWNLATRKAHQHRVESE